MENKFWSARGVKKQFKRFSKRLIGIFRVVLPLLVVISSAVSLDIPSVSNFSVPKIKTLYPITFESKKISFEIAKSRDEEAKEASLKNTEKNNQRIQALARKASGRSELDRELKRLSLEELRKVYKQAAAKFNIDWRLLEAVHEVESGKSIDAKKVSYMGAEGPMQFLPSTFRKYAEDGDGDGVAKVTSYVDSIYAAAKLLAANGAASGQEERALFAYNHAQWYVQKVLRVKASIQE